MQSVLYSHQEIIYKHQKVVMKSVQKSTKKLSGKRAFEFLELPDVYQLTNTICPRANNKPKPW